MRAVLIATSDGSRSSLEGAPRAASGRPVAMRQLDFALACGCQEVLVLGDPGSRDVSHLVQAARSRGAVARLVSDAHGLLGLLHTNDELLVLAAGVVPESQHAVEGLATGPRLLVLPADEAIPAGFERIDREYAWAGAAIIPGSLIERLAELPEDSDPPAALLRIALQARVPERRLPDSVLTDGSWLMVEGASVPTSVDGWRRRQLATSEPSDWTGKFARTLLRRWPEYLRADRRTILALTAGSVLLLVIAVILSWFGHSAIGLALLAPCTLSLVLGQILRAIEAGPFAQDQRRWRVETYIPKAIDLALGVCGALAIDGAWLGRLFPPTVLLIALHRTPSARSGALGLLQDRMVLPLVTAIAAALDLAEPVFMALALAFLLGHREQRSES